LRIDHIGDDGLVFAREVLVKEIDKFCSGSFRCLAAIQMLSGHFLGPQLSFFYVLENKHWWHAVAWPGSVHVILCAVRPMGRRRSLE
jgi:hypothetical protein